MGLSYTIRDLLTLQSTHYTTWSSAASTSSKTPEGWQPDTTKTRLHPHRFNPTVDASICQRLLELGTRAKTHCRSLEQNGSDQEREICAGLKHAEFMCARGLHKCLIARQKSTICNAETNAIVQLSKSGVSE